VGRWLEAIIPLTKALHVGALSIWCAVIIALSLMLSRHDPGLDGVPRLARLWIRVPLDHCAELASSGVGFAIARRDHPGARRGSRGSSAALPADLFSAPNNGTAQHKTAAMIALYSLGFQAR
jgi:hypothetical protein